MLQEVVTSIHPNDAMVNRDHPEGYFLMGEAGLECIQRFVSTTPETVLDLPCGHGRVLRFLRAEWPDADITACDIDRGGVDFCAKTFDATPLYSADDPSEIQTGTFDLIWVGSLLTHFSSDRWDAWLRFFADHLNPRGSVVFTTNGRAFARGEIPVALPPEFAEMQADYEQTGFAFHERWELSLSSPSWVFARLPDLNVQFAELGWHGLMDAWCLTASP